MCRKFFGQHKNGARPTEEVGEFGETFESGLQDSKKSETSQMHFDVESIADSELEGGELQMMLTSPLHARKVSGRPDALVVQE